MRTATTDELTQVASHVLFDIVLAIVVVNKGFYRHVGGVPNACCIAQD